jgi:hypothetical protein
MNHSQKNPILWHKTEQRFQPEQELRGIRGRAARGRATQQNQEEGEPGTSHTTAARGRGKRNGTIGREEWLMFGHGGVNRSQQPDATVLQSTQEPPPV